MELLPVCRKFLIRGGIKTEAYRYCVIDTIHNAVLKTPHALLKTSLIKRSYLLEQYDRVLVKTAVDRGESDMGRKLCLVGLACYCGGNDGRAESVPDIILNDKYRSDSALLAANDRT